MPVRKIGESRALGDLRQLVRNARRASGFLKALAHESRLTILCNLVDGEKSVGELEEFLSLRQSTVSQQLARLRLEGLVATRREGKMIFYRIANDDVRTMLATVYAVFCKGLGGPARSAGQTVSPMSGAALADAASARAPASQPRLPGRPA